MLEVYDQSVPTYLVSNNTNIVLSTYLRESTVCPSFFVLVWHGSKFRVKFFLLSLEGLVSTILCFYHDKNVGELAIFTKIKNHSSINQSKSSQTNATKQTTLQPSTEQTNAARSFSTYTTLYFRFHSSSWIATQRRLSRYAALNNITVSF